MLTSARLNRVYRESERLCLHAEQPIVLMSDIHRGTGNANDNFQKNRLLFSAALRHYEENGYVYVELGDGDELWENKSMDAVITAHDDVFFRLASLYRAGRFYMLYGNHDMIKRKPAFVERHLAQYYDACRQTSQSLFPELRVREGLVLLDSKSGRELLVLHGHQGDPLNDTLWRLARFLVRYVWRPLELFGVKNPTSASQSCGKQKRIAEQYAAWAKRQGKTVIAGHTHQAVFPQVGSAYFNDGCCVRPGSIQALELCGGEISLVKWQLQTDRGARLFVGREVLETKQL